MERKDLVDSIVANVILEINGAVVYDYQNEKEWDGIREKLRKPISPSGYKGMIGQPQAEGELK
jgi:hypothetical protein